MEMVLLDFRSICEKDGDTVSSEASEGRSTDTLFCETGTALFLFTGRVKEAQHTFSSVAAIYCCVTTTSELSGLK